VEDGIYSASPFLHFSRVVTRNVTMGSIQPAINNGPVDNKTKPTYEDLERILASTNIGHIDSTIEVLGAHIDKDAK